MEALLRALVLSSLLVGPRALGAQEASCPPADAAAGMAVVMGTVVDVVSGAAVAAAQVELRRPRFEAPLRTQSDRDGRFLFCSVPAGEFVVSAREDERRGAVGPVSVEPGATLEVVVEVWSATGASGTLGGEIVDAETEKPVEGASVFLPQFGQSSVSNQLGRFVFPSLPPGKVALEVRRLGYADARGAVEIEVGRTTETRVSLAVEAIGLEPIVVTGVRRRIQLPGLEDFERRYFSGWGEFVLEEEIRLRNPSKLSQMLPETGVEVLGNGMQVIIKRTGCAPMVYIDDVKMTHLPRGGGPQRPQRFERNSLLYPWPDPERDPAQEAADAVNRIHPSEILAVEVYRGSAETPGQYLDSDSRCGVILIWTKRGGDVRRR